MSRLFDCMLECGEVMRGECYKGSLSAEWIEAKHVQGVRLFVMFLKRIRMWRTMRTGE